VNGQGGKGVPRAHVGWNTGDNANVSMNQGLVHRIRVHGLQIRWGPSLIFEITETGTHLGAASLRVQLQEHRTFIDLTDLHQQQQQRLLTYYINKYWTSANTGLLLLHLLQTDVLPSQYVGIVLKKLNLTQQKQTTQEWNSLRQTRKKHTKEGGAASFPGQPG